MNTDSCIYVPAPAVRLMKWRMKSCDHEILGLRVLTVFQLMTGFPHKIISALIIEVRKGVRSSAIITRVGKGVGEQIIEQEIKILTAVTLARQ